MSALRYMKNEEKFTLTGEEQAQALELEAYPAATPDDSEAFQVELFLPESNPEAPQPSPQIEFEGMPIPRYETSINEHRSVYFQHANTLLESLEAQDVNVHYQCREGYCGSRSEERRVGKECRSRWARYHEKKKEKKRWKRCK